jgi:signal transduction histidine kinase/CheY-like chemotaxis protein
MKDEVEVLKRALERERVARKTAEQLLEAKSRELYDAHQSKKAELEQLVQERTHELSIARDQALEASRAKSQFLAKMSHELRTPLNAILGYSEMLEEDAQADARERDAADLRKIQVAGKHLLALINDVLDLSKIEAGQVALYLEDVDLAALVEEVQSTVRPIVEKNGNRFVVDVPADIGAVRADVTKVRQALFNLLSNAAKFTEQGQVELTARRDERTVSFSVRDTGIGMTEEQMKHLFTPFRQADASTARRYGGTGLGLAISQRFAQLLGGDITARSEPERGSTFTLTFPVRSSSSDRPPASVAPSSGPKGTVLVIDDDVEARELLGRLLAAEGYGVIEARDGQQGLELARVLRPVAITLDVVMPKVDGWSVLAALKADPSLADIPVIVVSVLGERALALSLGATEYVTKPVDRDRLSSLLRRHLSARGYVLVVDDDPDARELMSRAVAELGHEPVAVDGGAGAQRELRTRRHDLVLLDLLMPEMDGFALLDWMRATPDQRDIPVVVMTAKDLTVEDRARLSGSVSSILQKASTSHRDLTGVLGSLLTEER